MFKTCFVIAEDTPVSCSCPLESPGAVRTPHLALVTSERWPPVMGWSRGRAVPSPPAKPLCPCSRNHTEEMPPSCQGPSSQAQPEHTSERAGALFKGCFHASIPKEIYFCWDWRAQGFTEKPCVFKPIACNHLRIYFKVTPMEREDTTALPALLDHKPCNIWGVY